MAGPGLPASYLIGYSDIGGAIGNYTDVTPGTLNIANDDAWHHFSWKSVGARKFWVIKYAGTASQAGDITQLEFLTNENKVIDFSSVSAYAREGENISSSVLDLICRNDKKEFNYLKKIAKTLDERVNLDIVGRLQVGFPDIPAAYFNYSEKVLEDAPLGYWRLGETAGTNADDSSGNNNDGTYQNSPTLGQAGLIENDPDLAVLFDGTDDQCDFPNNLFLSSNRPTIEVWIKPSVLPNAVTDIVQIISTVSKIYMRTTGSNLITFTVVTTGGSVTVTSTTALTTAQPYHLVGRYDGSTVKLFVNGVEEDSASQGGNLDFPAAVVSRIGGSTGGAGFINAVFDEVAFYNYPLNPDRIQKHYQGEYIDRFKGILEEVRLIDEERHIAQLVFSDKLLKAVEKRVGSANGPVNFYSQDYNPADLAWELMQIAQLDDTESVENEDIDYASWLKFKNLCQNLGYKLRAQFRGQPVSEGLRLIGELTDSLIFGDTSGKIVFRPFYPSDYFSPNHYEDSNGEIDQGELVLGRRRLFNDIFVYYGYDPGTQTWTDWERVSDGTSKFIYGNFVKTIENATVWHSTSASAFEFAIKFIYHYSFPFLTFRMKTRRGTKAMIQQIGDAVEVSHAHNEISQKPFLIHLLEFDVSEDLFIMEMEAHPYMDFDFFILDSSTHGVLDQNVLF